MTMVAVKRHMKNNGLDQTKLKVKSMRMHSLPAFHILSIPATMLQSAPLQPGESCDTALLSLYTYLTGRHGALNPPAYFFAMRGLQHGETICFRSLLLTLLSLSLSYFLSYVLSPLSLRYLFSMSLCLSLSLSLSFSDPISLSLYIYIFFFFLCLCAINLPSRISAPLSLSLSISLSRLARRLALSLLRLATNLARSRSLSLSISVSLALSLCLAGSLGWERTTVARAQLVMTFGAC